MKKVLSYSCIIIGLVLLFSGTSRDVVAYIWERKHHQLWWGEHQSNFGDLSNIAYLDDIKVFQTPNDYNFTPPADTSGPKNIDLYLFGDSYTEDVPCAAFAHVNTCHFGRKGHHDLVYKLDKSKRNVLLIETAERYVRSNYQNGDIYNHIRKDLPPALTLAISEPGPVYASVGAGLHVADFFNPNINQNLEYLLFNVNAMNKPRLLKADMNYYLFNRGSGDVVIADDGRHLFLKETVEPKNECSSYQPFSNEDVTAWANNLNVIYEHYKAEGFDEVYFAIVPNPASVIQPANYNNLIPKLQTSPGLKMQMVDVYSHYKNAGNPRQFYRAGDTHWNNKGMQLWLMLVNEQLSRQSAKP